MTETKQERRVRIQRQRAKKKNKNFFQRKKVAEVRAGNSYKKRKQKVADELSQRQALREIRVENRQCRLKHIDRRLRGFNRFTKDPDSINAILNEESDAIILENEQFIDEVKAHEKLIERSEASSVIDLTEEDDNELTRCLTTYDDIERHERKLDEEFGELIPA